MASNTSQRKAKSILLKPTVGEYASWSLLVTCRPCGMPRTLSMATLPANLTIMQLLTRMRCRTCRDQVAAAALDNGVRGWEARVVRVWGPGSYG